MPRRARASPGPPMRQPARVEPAVDVALADQLLSTTRSVRKRLDLLRPVEPALIERAIEVALQAPTGSNSQGWHFVVVTDAEKRAGLAALYRRAFHAYVSQQVPWRPQLPPDDPRARQLPRILDSATYLAEHLHEVPVHVLPCVEGGWRTQARWRRPPSTARSCRRCGRSCWRSARAVWARRGPRSTSCSSRKRRRSSASRRPDPGRAAAGRLLYRRRVQA